MSQNSGAPTDPYIAAKGNIRDTVKWLAATFAGLAALTIAGAPLSGLGKLASNWGTFVVATMLLFVAFIALCWALWRVLDLLRSDTYFFSDLRSSESGRQGLSKFESELRNDVIADINSHREDLLPPEYDTVDELCEEYFSAEKHLRDLVKPTGKALVATYEDAVGLAQAKLSSLQAYMTRVRSYGSYAKLAIRWKHTLIHLFWLGVVALLSLTAFGVVTVMKGKGDTARADVVNNWTISGATTACSPNFAPSMLMQDKPPESASTGVAAPTPMP